MSEIASPDVYTTPGAFAAAKQPPNESSHLVQPLTASIIDYGTSETSSNVSNKRLTSFKHPDILARCVFNHLRGHHIERDLGIVRP